MTTLEQISLSKLERDLETPDIEQAVLGIAYQKPQLGCVRASQELERLGISVTAGEVRRIWYLHCLETVPKRKQAVRLAYEDILLPDE